ncbi:MAG: cytochrome c-type biogenesis CcmF C-terminal domain-containing protein [Acidobacteriota bacterium]
MLEALSHLYLPGALTLWCAIFFGVATLWGYARALRDDGASLGFARSGYLFFTLSILLAGAVLFLALWRRDFRIEYVQQYSGMELAEHFQLAAFWAGQKGSFLIWLMWGAVLGLPLLRTAGRSEPTVMSVYLLTLFGLLFILVRENPFVMLPETPMDGAGLNPLLQDDWMVIHPPIMFIGYASAAVPFSFALAALWRGDFSTWATRAFPWALAGFLVLGLAIMLGGYWAYETLGWGGYWGWDPVENASLIPWLIGGVLIHGLYLERSRGRYRRLNLVLSCLLYLSVLYGTFLTRSGVLADFSVHSFVDLGISGWLVALMAFFFFASIFLLATRLRHVPTRTNEDPMLSRGTALVLATLTLGASALVVTFGTSAPLITGWFMESPGQVGPEFYNTVNMPLALMLSILLATVPFLTWRGVEPGKLLRRLVPSFLAAVAITVLGLIIGLEEVFHAVFLFLAAWASTANLHRVIELVRDRGVVGIGGYLSHVGVGVMLIGVLASGAYDQSAKVTLPQGEAVAVDDMSFTFTRFIPRQGREKERMEVLVERGNDRFTLYPKLFVNDRTRQLMANPDIRTTPLQDLYVSPIQYLPPQPPRVDERVDMAQGERVRIGPLDIRFIDYQVEGGDPRVALASGRSVEVGAVLEVSRDGDSQRLEPIFRFRSDGRVETPPLELAQSGTLALTGIDPNSGRIQLDILGVQADELPARLSIDVTQKPLIQLVWLGLAIILTGGGLSTLKRFKTVRKLDEQEAAAAAVG